MFVTWASYFIFSCVDFLFENGVGDSILEVFLDLMGLVYVSIWVGFGLEKGFMYVGFAC